MNQVIQILMERDGLTEKEANELLSDVRDMICEDPDEAEDIVMEELGLEMDYIFDILE